MLQKKSITFFLFRCFLLILVSLFTILKSVYPQNLNYVSKTGGICFRTDDDQDISKYLEYAALFDKYNQKFSFAIFLGGSVGGNEITPDYINGLRQLQASGYEMMDHTPQHATNYFNTILPTDYYVNNPGVQRISGNKIELKHADVDIADAKRTGYVNINGNIITSSNGIFSSFSKSDCYLYFPTLDKLVFISEWAGWIDKDTVQVLDPWYNDIDLGIHQNIQFYNFDYNNVHLTVDAIKVLAEESIRLSNYYNLERPYTWIQPGSYFPRVHRDEAKQALGDALGYKSAGLYPDPSLKVFNEYNPNNDKQFGMDWGDFNEDIWTLDQCKQYIADGIAKHHVLIGHSHFIYAEDGSKIDWQDFLNRTEGLLQWCVANNIPIRTYSEWSDILYNQTPDPNENIFPPLNVDLDANNIPDGYDSSIGTLVKNDQVPGSNDFCYSINNVGQICSITGLGGVEKGTNEFEIWTKGARGDFIEVNFKVGSQNLVYKFPAKSSKWTKYNLTQSVNGNTSLNIPVDVSLIDVTIKCSNYTSGNVKIGGMKLAKSLDSNVYLSITPLNQNVSYSAGNANFEVTSNTSWIINDDADWLSVSPNNGSNSGVLTASYMDNPFTSQRIGTITISSNGIVNTVTLTQDAMPFELSVTPEEQNVGPMEDITILEVKSNTNWEVSNDADWLSVSPVNGSNNGTLNVNYTDNPSTIRRVGTLTVSGGDITKTVTIQQEPKKFLTFSPGDTVLPADSGSFNFIIESNTTWELKDDFEWLHLNKYSGSDSDTVSISYDSNEEITSRPGLISIYYGDDSSKISINQNARSYLYVNPDTEVVNADSNVIKIKIESNIAWKIKSGVNWISTNPDSGNGIDSIVINYKANNDSLTRIGDLFFTGKDLSNKFVLKQKGLSNYIINAFADPSEAGTVSGYGNYLYGTSANMVAIPSNGWEFVDWKEDSLVVSNDSCYSFIVTSQRVLVAKFTKILNVADNENGMPKNYELYQNYPNPFNPSTKIKYSIPNSSFVKLKVYDILGNEIATLVNTEQSAGYYDANFSGSSLPSGVYIYRLEAGNFVSTKKFLLLK